MIHINVREGSWSDILIMDFYVAVLSEDDAPLAFPLVQAAWAGADLLAWRSFVRTFQGEAGHPGTGLLAIRDQADTICGVLAYRVGLDGWNEQAFNAELFIAADIVNSPRPVRALLDAAEARAGDLGCRKLQIRLYGSQKVLASRLRGLGLSLGRNALWTKHVEPPTRN
jgi:hypothetical protein